METSDALVLLSITWVFGTAFGLRFRKWRGRLIGIPLAALLVPAATAFVAYVHPALPEVRIWWPVMSVTTSIVGLAAAALGHAAAWKQARDAA